MPSSPIPNSENPCLPPSFLEKYKSLRSKKMARLFLVITVMGLGIGYFVKKGADFSRLLDISLLNLCIATSVIFLSFFMYGLRFKQLFGPFKISLENKEWLGLPMILSTGNLFFFKAGTVTMAIYLKNRHQLSFTKFIAIMTVDKILSIYGLNILGLALCYHLYINQYIPLYVAIALFASLLIFTYALYIHSIRLPKGKNRAFDLISRLLDSWHHYKRDANNQIKLIVLHLLYMVSWAARYYVAFRILNHPVSATQCLVLSFTSFLTGLFTLIPGSLGIRETTVGLTIAFLGSNFDQGVFAATLDRVLATLWSSLFAFIYFQILHIKGYQRDKALEASPEFKG